MSYVYAWLCDSVPFYFGVSENKDGQYQRSKRMQNSNICESVAEKHYRELTNNCRCVDVKIVMDNLIHKEALLLESALIMKFRSKLKNVFYLDLRLNETKDTDIRNVASELIEKIRNGVIKSTYRTRLTSKPKLLYITTSDSYDIIGYDTFNDRYDMSIEKFLKSESPTHHKISKIEFDFLDGREEINF